MTFRTSTRTKAGLEDKATAEAFDPTPYEKHGTRFTPKLILRYDSTTHPPFNGVARSMICMDHNGFRNFKIVELQIVNGRVEKIAYSDSFAAFEASAKLDIINDFATLSLNANWMPGKTWEK